MPATSARAVSINAAFLQEIKDDHRELRELLARLASQLGEASSVSWVEIVQLLQSLRERLAMHFALEEAYGYCEDVIQVAPRLSNLAERLRSQHQTLFSTIQQIVESAELGLSPESDACPRENVTVEFERFVRALEDHERRECDLIFEAYARDLGSGD